MDAFKKKVLLLPLLGLGVFAGVSQFSDLNTHASRGANFSVIVAAKYLADQSNKSDDKDENGPAVEGKVVRFWEGKELIIDDGNGRIVVDYQDKWRPLNLKVGQPVTVRGDLSNSGSTRTLSATEIRSSNGLVYPQEVKVTHVRNDGLAPFLSDASSDVQPQTTADGKVYMIRELVEKSPAGEVVVIKGEVVELPSEDMLILKDVSGQVSVDIDDAQKTLHLKKGDKVTIHGSLNDKKQLEAAQIEKN